MKSTISPQLYMVWQMTALCLAWGIVVGVLVDVVLNPITDRYFPPVLPIAIISAMFGLGYGIVALVLSVSLGKRKLNRFRFVLLILVFGIAVTCFPFADTSLFATILERKPSTALNLILLTLHAVSVAAFSQIVARRYVSKTAPRKRKQKPA